MFPQPGPRNTGHPPYHAGRRLTPLKSLLLFPGTLRGWSEDLVTDGKIDFEVRHMWLSCLVTVTLSESHHLLEPLFPCLCNEGISSFLEGC